MTNLVSNDGTTIAFERLGQGKSVIVIGGALCDRSATRPLAERLAEHFTVFNYDRRGRGESGDTAPYAIDRELEDLTALIAEAGGRAAVYGHSSGAGLAIHAAASGLPIASLVLHEPPYGPDDEASKRTARELAEGIVSALAENRPADAISLFFTAAGMPPEMTSELSNDPNLLTMAPTLAYDFEIMGDARRGGAIPEELVKVIDIPTLVLAGTASPDFFQATASRIAELLPNGKYLMLPDQDHGAPAEVVAPVVAEFLVTQGQSRHE